MKVAVAVITDSSNRLLLTRRSLSTSHGGLWEFPGGKLELDEQPEQALLREVREEVGLECLAQRYLGEIVHHYPQKTVALLVYHVFAHTGEPHCLESQLDMRWVDLAQLTDFSFPEANYKVIDLIKAEFKVCTAQG